MVFVSAQADNIVTRRKSAAPTLRPTSNFRIAIVFLTKSSLPKPYYAGTINRFSHFIADETDSNVNPTLRHIVSLYKVTRDDFDNAWGLMQPEQTSKPGEASPQCGES